MSFLKYMSQRAAQDIKTIVLPESTDMRVLTAAEEVSKQGFAKVILLGNPKDIQELGGDLDLSKVEIVDYINSDKFEEYAQAFYELRKAKGISVEDARETLKDPLYYGAMMVKKNDADGMVAGAVNSTPNTIRPALQVIKTRKDAKLVSSFLVMVIPDSEYGYDGNFVFSDCGLVENPNADELSEIAIASAASFKQLFEHEPIVAMLSYSTMGSAKSDMTMKVVEATKLAKEKAPTLMVDGELQSDAAIVPSIGAFKAPNSPVAGKANVLIFPNLNAGNISCKLVERLAKAELYGPITQGLNQPVNDLSRGCKAEDIVGAVAITAVQAQFV